jgi:hypothetical protein
MGEQARSRMAMAGAAAVVALALAVMMPVMKGYGAYSPDHGPAGSGRHAVTSNVADKVESDPTDDGSIIIECVALGNRLTTGASGLEEASQRRLVGVPRFPLGPSKCWPEHQG